MSSWTRRAWRLTPGFNAIDLKVTHGYLLNELLGAKQRPGPTAARWKTARA